MKKFLRYWLPVWLFCIAIFVQSSFPSSEKLPDFNYSDKLLHIGAYAVLSMLFFRAITAGNPGWRPAFIAMSCIVFTTLYGISDEIHQHFVPSRTGDVKDMVADFIGGAVGALFMVCFYKRRPWVSKTDCSRK